MKKPLITLHSSTICPICGNVKTGIVDYGKQTQFDEIISKKERSEINLVKQVGYDYEIISDETVEIGDCDYIDFECSNHSKCVLPLRLLSRFSKSTEDELKLMNAEDLDTVLNYCEISSDSVKRELIGEISKVTKLKHFILDEKDFNVSGVLSKYHGEYNLLRRWIKNLLAKDPKRHLSLAEIFSMNPRDYDNLMRLSFFDSVPYKITTHNLSGVIYKLRSGLTDRDYSLLNYNSQLFDDNKAFFEKYPDFKNNILDMIEEQNEFCLKFYLILECLRESEFAYTVNGIFMYISDEEVYEKFEQYCDEVYESNISIPYREYYGKYKQSLPKVRRSLSHRGRSYLLIEKDSRFPSTVRTVARVITERKNLNRFLAPISDSFLDLNY